MFNYKKLETLDVHVNGHVNSTFSFFENLKLLKWIEYIFMRENGYTSKYYG